MPLPALQKFERQIERQLRLLEARKYLIERKIERQIRLFERKRDNIGKKIEDQFRQFERKKGIRLDDEVRFIRSWIERPLSIGAVTPSGRLLARAMARYVDPASDGPIIELGPGTALSGFMKRIDKSVTMLNVADVASLRSTTASLRAPPA